jgi:class 3 adenylate cyclase
MSDIALKHGATIDKYRRRDRGVLRVRDKGLKEDALACVRMAIAMVRRCVSCAPVARAWRREAVQAGSASIPVTSLSACFPGSDRMDYTIIGNAVRPDRAAAIPVKSTGILLGHETYSLVKDEVAAEEQTPIKVKGFAGRGPAVKGLALDSREGTLNAERGFKFHLNLQKRNKEDAIRIIEGILSRLKA